MTNWTISHVNQFLTACGECAVLVLMGMGIAAMMTTCTIPHDFGKYNNLKTICHVWEGRDGYRRQATTHINSSENIHGSHAWDYDGECAK